MDLKISHCSCLSFTILIFCLLQVVNNASTPVTWVADTRFIASKIFDNVGSFSYSPSVSGSVNQIVQTTYPNSMTTAATRLVCLGILDYQFHFSTTTFYFKMIDYWDTDTYLQVEVQTSYGSDVKTLKISYLAVDPAFTDPFSISYFTTTQSPPVQGPFSINYYVNFTASTGVILNLAHSNAMLAFQHIMNVYSPTKCFQVNIVFQIFNSSFYQVIISTQCSLQMSSFGFSRMIFDKTAIEAQGFCFFAFGQLVATNGNVSPLTYTTSPFFVNNFMIGMKNFYVDGPNMLKFSTSVSSTTSVTSNIAFKYLSFMYWSFRKRVCPAGYPFFEVSTSLCYDTCPNGFYSNSTNYMCLACSYTCQTCSSFSVCTNCDPVTNRYLNGTTCPASPGYFDNGTANAVLCNSTISGCLQCTNNITCINCTSGTYLASNSTCPTCSSAISNCSTCSYSGSILICNSCMVGFALGASNTTCVANPCVDPYCTSCPTNTSICQICISTGGYTLTANSTCITTCGDGFTAGIQQCDDGNNVDGDGCNSDCTIGNNNNCSITTPYIDPITNLCTAICPDGYFENITTFTCQICSYTCNTCSNITSCDTCSASSNRVLTSGQCLPASGFYDNSTINAVPCVSPCATCTSVSVCVTCVTGYYLSGTSCVPCSNSIANCTLCDITGTTCSGCQLGFIYNATTNLCDVVPCYDLFCLACPSSMSVCSVCTSGYQPVNGVCQTVCGDFIKMSNQVCDDGNSADNDGCSSTCTVEADFTCEPSTTNPAGSACFYTGTVAINTVYVNKVNGQNQIQILFDLQPSNLSLINTMSPAAFMSMIQLSSPVPITGYNVVNNNDGTVSVTVDYAGDLQGQTISVQIDPTRAGLPALSRSSPSTYAVVVNPDNNQAASFYDDSTYKTANIISTVSTAISAAAMVFCVLGLISGKMVGVEMMAVIQISFFSLVSLSQLNPCFAALASLKLVNGYNSLNNDYLKDQLTPTAPKGIFLFSRFTENFNFTLAIVLIPLLVALVSFILSKTALKQNEKVVQVAKKAIGQYTLMGLLFGSYLIAVSFGLQLMYGKNKTSDLIGLASLIECAVLLLMLIGYFVFLLMKPEFFGEFTQQFKKDKLSSKYYNFMLVQRLLVGSGLVFLLAVKVEVALPIAIFLITGIFVAVKKPYKENYHNHRVMCNMTIAITVEGIYLAYKMVDPAVISESKIFSYLPFIVCGLLLICVIYNGAAIIYGIYKNFSSKTLIQQLEKEQLDQLAKLRNNTIINNPPSPINAQDFFNTSLDKQSLMNPLTVRKQLNMNDIKKQLVRMNPTNNQIGLANTIILERSQPINIKFKNEYQAI